MQIETYAWTSLITVLSLIVYFATAINVGRARSKYEIKPPATTGNPDFERAFRIQQNTLEQLVFFLPLLWLFTLFVNPLWGAVIGGVWVLGRIIFAIGYSLAAEKRTIGFVLSMFASLSLLIGSLIGIIKALIA